MKINIKQSRTTASEKQLTTFSDVIVLISDTAGLRRWPDFPWKKLLQQRLKEAGKTTLDKPFTTPLPVDSGTRLSLFPLDASVSRFEQLSAMRKLLNEHVKNNGKRLAVLACGKDEAGNQAGVSALAAALYAAQADMPDYKTGKKPAKPARELVLYGAPGFNNKRILAEAEGNNLARYLTALPANELRPGSYIQRIRKLARQHGWKMQVLGMAELKKRKAGAFLAVAQGNDGDAGGIVHLSYTPAKASRKQLALVGKGICFDTGGMNLKPAAHMQGMHEDMEGSAVALGTLLTLTRLGVNFSIHCWLAITENHIGAKAYRQNDVVTAMNGTSIEIVHTDAEGRMVLADTLTLAGQSKPDLIIDYATLTGTCVSALGTAYSGIFGNDEDLLQKAVAAGRASGERVWAFPHDEDFDIDLESEIADIKQCLLSGGPDHIHGARFLGRFVPKNTRWMHVDLSAGNNKGGLAHIPTDITGFGVHFTTSLLLDQQAL